MKPDLLGYVLKTLEPAEELAVEEFLENHSEARREVQRLRPLLNAMHEDDAEPSKELIYRTLRSVANQHSAGEVASSGAAPVKATRKSGQLPKLEPWTVKEYEVSPTNWRRADAWALIAVVMLILLAIPPVLQYVRDRAMQVECKDNMRQLYQAFHKYMEDHQGNIPRLAPNGPNSRAGIYATMLHDSGLWGERMRLSCPPNSSSIPQSLEEVQKHGDDEHSYWQNFAGSYAYNLGYLHNNDGNVTIQSVKRGDGDSIAILADRPPRLGEVANCSLANSPNHGGRGQNVLHLGGHVIFYPGRSNTQGDDRDIFRNINNQTAAGLHVHDSVLAPSEAKALPSAVPND